MLQITEHKEGHTTTLKLSGRFDFQARKGFQTAIARAQSTNPHAIILNFSAVSFIDSSGLGMIMLIKKNWSSADCHLSLAVPPGYVKDVFDLAHLETMFSITAVEATIQPSR